MPKPFICPKCGFDCELAPSHDCDAELNKVNPVICNSFVMISSTGKYAMTTHTGGGFGDQSHNDIITVDNINSASLFDARSKRDKPYKTAIQNGFIEIPAYATRIVTLGVRPDE